MEQQTPVINPQQTILLVMDYQNGIINSLPNADELLARMAETIKIARECGLLIGYVRVAFTASDYANVPATNKSFTTLSTSRSMSDEAPETQLPAAIAPEKNDIIVRKTRVGAFSTTDLMNQLKERNINTLALAGIATSGVVLSTLRAAADMDYRIYVLEDLCADRDPEVHKVLIEKVFPRQAYVITSAELPSLFAQE